LRRIALVGPDDAYGALAVQAFNQVMGQLGAAPTVALYPPDGAPDAALAGLLSGDALANLDAILIADGGQRMTRVAALLRGTSANAAGLRLLGTSRWQDDTSVLREPGLYGSWVAGVAPSDRAAFEQRFRAAFGRTPHELAALSYDATALAVLLARSAGAFDAQTITDPQGFVGSLGAFRVRSDGTTQHRLAILEVRPEGLVVIDPAPQDFVDRLAAVN
jgi:ABC-type branched-subunit amino acid transport system substrate-binding protein